ncbi:MAG: hypothetical protein KGL39_35555 [Patescibacteria group bacterium]|nr:hypothetical protein [Patescibacteria group bacterium]
MANLLKQSKDRPAKKTEQPKTDDLWWGDLWYLYYEFEELIDADKIYLGKTAKTELR